MDILADITPRFVIIFKIRKHVQRREDEVRDPFL